MENHPEFLDGRIAAINLFQFDLDIYEITCDTIMKRHICPRFEKAGDQCPQSCPDLRCSWQKYSDLRDSNRRLSTLYSRNTPKAFHEEPGRFS